MFTLEQVTKAQRRSRGFFNLGARRGGWSTPRPGRFTPGKDPVPIVEEAGWASGPVWTGAENLAHTELQSPDRPARSQSLYTLHYPAHTTIRSPDHPARSQSLYTYSVRYTIPPFSDSQFSCSVCQMHQHTFITAFTPAPLPSVTYREPDQSTKQLHSPFQLHICTKLSLP